MKAVTATRAEIDARIDHSTTFRAFDSYRISQQEVEDESDCIWNENDKKGPQSAVHSALAGIFVHIAHHQCQESQNSTREKSEHDLEQPRRAEIRQPHTREPEKNDWNCDKHNYRDNVCPRRDSHNLFPRHFRHLPCCHRCPQLLSMSQCRHAAAAAKTVAGKNHHMRNPTCQATAGM